MDLRQLRALARRQRAPQLLRRRPRAAHGAVERLAPTSPARARAGRRPHRPGHERAHRGGLGRRRAGPAHRGRVRRALDSDVASLRDEVAGQGPGRRHRHDRPLARPAAARGARRAPPRGQRRHPRRDHQLARPPARRRARSTSPSSTCPIDDADLVIEAALRRGPRPRRAGRPPAVRRASRSRSPSSPSTSCCSRPRAPASATSSTPQAAEPGVELRAQAEVDGMRLLASLAFSGFGAAVLPASAAPAWVGGDWRRIPIEGCRIARSGWPADAAGCPPPPSAPSPSMAAQVVVDESPRQAAASTPPELARRVVDDRRERTVALTVLGRGGTGRRRMASVADTITITDNRTGEYGRGPHRQRRGRRQGVGEAPARRLVLRPVLRRHRGGREPPSPSSTARRASCATAATPSSSWPSSRATSRSPTC